MTTKVKSLIVGILIGIVISLLIFLIYVVKISLSWGS